MIFYLKNSFLRCPYIIKLDRYQNEGTIHLQEVLTVTTLMLEIALDLNAGN